MRLNPKPKTLMADETDGRRRRTVESRARIVAAMLQLVHDGDVTPNAEMVATRASIGLRSVFRHFKDMGSLYQEMSAVIEAELATIIDHPITANLQSQRLAQIVERRAAAFEKMFPYKRAGDLPRHRSAFLDAGHARLNARARAILLEELPAEAVTDDLLFEAVDMLLSWETWSRLRRNQGLSPQQAQDVLGATLHRLMAGLPK